MLLLHAISFLTTGLQDLLIRLNNTDVKLRDKRFPRQQPKPAEGSPRTVYTGLEYHDYGAGSHHWPGEEGAGEGGVAPKPWMVPAIPLPSGPKVEGWRRSTTPKGESKFQSGLGSVNSFSTEALDEIDESPILPRAQLKRSDSIDDDTLQVGWISLCMVTIIIHCVELLSATFKHSIHGTHRNSLTNGKNSL